jgi:hypothetical protein
VRFEANRHGARGDAIPEGDVFRIAILGGSSVECYLLDQPVAWPAVVQRELNEPDARAALGGRAVHVDNFGKSGFDVPVLTQIAERVLPRYAPLDMVMLMPGIGTALRWLNEGAPADRGPTPYELQWTWYWQPRDDYEWTPRGAALTEIARRLRWLILRPVLRKSNVGRWVGRARLMRVNAKERVAATGDPTVMLEELRRDLTTTLRALRQSSTRVVVVEQPYFASDHFTPEEEATFWTGGIGNVLTEQVDRFFTTEAVMRTFDLVNRTVGEVATAEGVEFLSLRAALPNVQTNYYDQNHFTPAGAEIVGRAVADFVVAGARAPAAR